MSLKVQNIKLFVIFIVVISLTGCSTNKSVLGKEEMSKASCIDYLDKNGVFGVGYSGLINQKFFKKGKVSSVSDLNYMVDSKNHTAFYNTGEIGSTSFFFPDGSVINKADTTELNSMKPLFAQLKLKTPKWFKIEGEKLNSTTENDPVLSTYMGLVKKHNSFSEKSNVFTYTSWENKKYKILAINCKGHIPSQVTTRYGDFIGNKAVDVIKTVYTIKYNNPNLDIPNDKVLNYTWLLNTKEGKYFIGKPITDVAFSFVINFIKVISPNKRLDNKVFAQYQKYIIESINNDPEMNGIVLTKKGDKLNGFIPLDGLDYYYCITLDRDTGKAKISDGKCSF